MKVEIFWRAWTAKSVRQIDFQSADAADTLDPGKLQFSATQGLRGPPAICDVAKRDPDAIAKRKSPHFVSSDRGATPNSSRIPLWFAPP